MKDKKLKIGLADIWCLAGELSHHHEENERWQLAMVKIMREAIQAERLLEEMKKQ